MSYSPRWDAAASLRRYFLTGINLNSLNTDVGTFTGLPAKYRVMRFLGYDASTNLTLATVSLNTAAANGGTAIVSAYALTGLSAAAKFADATLAVTADYQTASTLYLRNMTPQGGAATASFCLEICELQ